MSEPSQRVGYWDAIAMVSDEWTDCPMEIVTVVCGMVTFRDARLYVLGPTDVTTLCAAHDDVLGVIGNFRPESHKMTLFTNGAGALLCEEVWHGKIVSVYEHAVGLSCEEIVFHNGGKLCIPAIKLRAYFAKDGRSIAMGSEQVVYHGLDYDLHGTYADDNIIMFENVPLDIHLLVPLGNPEELLDVIQPPKLPIADIMYAIIMQQPLTKNYGIVHVDTKLYILAAERIKTALERADTQDFGDGIPEYLPHMRGRRQSAGDDPIGVYVLWRCGVHHNTLRQYFCRQDEDDMFINTYHDPASKYKYSQVITVDGRRFAFIEDDRIIVPLGEIHEQIPSDNICRHGRGARRSAAAIMDDYEV